MSGNYKLPVNFVKVDYMFQLYQPSPLSRRLAHQAELADSAAAALPQNGGVHLEERRTATDGNTLVLVNVSCYEGVVYAGEYVSPKGFQHHRSKVSI